jgi:phasin family protein
MVEKVAKKKSSKMSSVKAADKEPSAPKASSVIPFNPLSTISKFNQSTPSFGGSFESMESMMTNYKAQYEKFSGDATDSMRQGIESCVKSSTTFAKGAEQIVKTLTELAQGSSQRNAEAMKALMASRTLNEFAEAQNKIAQQNFEEAMSAATKISEMTIKLCTEAMEPINGQVAKAVKKASSSIAA